MVGRESAPESVGQTIRTNHSGRSARVIMGVIFSSLEAFGHPFDAGWTIL
jgi:hypothetical protein